MKPFFIFNKLNIPDIENSAFAQSRGAIFYEHRLINTVKLTIIGLGRPAQFILCLKQVILSVFHRRTPYMVNEKFGKVALAVVAAGSRDILDGKMGGYKKFLGMIQTQLRHIIIVPDSQGAL
mgnify:CR=1